MNIQTAKLDVMQKLMAVQELTLLEKINKLLYKELVVGHTTNGKPLTKKDYDRRLAQAENQIASGQHTTQEDLE